MLSRTCGPKLLVKRWLPLAANRAFDINRTTKLPVKNVFGIKMLIINRNFSAKDAIVAAQQQERQLYDSKLQF